MTHLPCPLWGRHPSQRWVWETSSQLCPEKGPLSLLVMPGINLQHRQGLGHGHTALTGNATVGRWGTVLHKLPQVAASAPPSAHWGPYAAPTCHQTLGPMGGGGCQDSVSVCVVVPGLCKQPGLVTQPQRVHAWVVPSPAPGAGDPTPNKTRFLLRGASGLLEGFTWEPLFHVLKLHASGE